MNSLMCFSCKEKFNRTEMITYKNHRYCKSCYEEKLERDKFSQYVCALFHIKAPGPKIWTQRKRLIEKGYTDDTILKTLMYLYEVKSKKKLTETLGLVSVNNINAALNYYMGRDIHAAIMAEAMINAPKEVKQIKRRDLEEKKTYTNPDDILANWEGDEE